MTTNLSIQVARENCGLVLNSKLVINFKEIASMSFHRLPPGDAPYGTVYWTIEFFGGACWSFSGTGDNAALFIETLKALRQAYPERNDWLLPVHFVQNHLADPKDRIYKRVA